MGDTALRQTFWNGLPVIMKTEVFKNHCGVVYIGNTIETISFFLPEPDMCSESNTFTVCSFCNVTAQRGDDLIPSKSRQGCIKAVKDIKHKNKNSSGFTGANHS